MSKLSDKEYEIFAFLRDNIKYHEGKITNAWQLSQKIAYELGFTDYIANIFFNSHLQVDTKGEANADANKWAKKAVSNIWG